MGSKATKEPKYEDLVQIVKKAATVIFRNDAVGQSIVDVLENEECKHSDEVVYRLDDVLSALHPLKESMLIYLIAKKCPDHSDDALFGRTVYDLLVRVFRDKMVDIPHLVALSICDSVVHSINEKAKKPMDGQLARSMMIEKQFDGETLLKMNRHEFVSIAMGYDIDEENANALWSGMRSFWDRPLVESASKNSEIPPEDDALEKVCDDSYDMF